MSPMVWALVVVIGGAGSVLRFLVDGAVASRVGGDFPYGTMVVNLSGSALLGLVSGAALGGAAGLLAGTAAVGSYTTFSTWMFETQRLGEERRHARATVNVVASLVVGVMLAAVGRWLGASL